VSKIKSLKYPISVAISALLVLVPLAPSWASINSWGNWNELENTLGFSGAGMVNADWEVDVETFEVDDTLDADEYFVSGTPIGSVFGANGPDENTNFLKVTAANSAILTVEFAAAVPAGSLGFAISDLDTDQVTVEATDLSGNPLSGEQIIGSATIVAFNYCDYPGSPCVDTAVPGITINAENVVAEGIESSTDGSTAWFRPNVAVKTIIFTFLNKDEPEFPSSARFWFAQSTPENNNPEENSLAKTGFDYTAPVSIFGFGIAIASAGAILYLRSRKT